MIVVGGRDIRYGCSEKLRGWPYKRYHPKGGHDERIKRLVILSAVCFIIFSMIIKFIRI